MLKQSSVAVSELTRIIAEANAFHDANGYVDYWRSRELAGALEFIWECATNSERFERFRIPGYGGYFLTRIATREGAPSRLGAHYRFQSVVADDADGAWEIVRWDGDSSTTLPILWALLDD